MACDPEEVTLDASLIDDLGAESIDFLDIVFRLERAFKVKIPRGKIVEEARGDLSEAEFEKGGVVTDAGLERLKVFLSEVPADRFSNPLKSADIAQAVHHGDVLQDGDAPAEGCCVARADRTAPSMDLHFRAFSFVDRILSLGPGDQITGQYRYTFRPDPLLPLSGRGSRPDNWRPGPR